MYGLWCIRKRRVWERWKMKAYAEYFTSPVYSLLLTLYRCVWSKYFPGQFIFLKCVRKDQTKQNRSSGSGWRISLLVDLSKCSASCSTRSPEWAQSSWILGGETHFSPHPCHILYIDIPLTVRPTLLFLLCSYLSNRPQVSMVYRLINHSGCW